MRNAERNHCADVKLPPARVAGTPVAAATSGVRKTYIDPTFLPAVETATLGRILACVRPYWAEAALLGACILLGAVLSLSLPWFAKQVIDVAIPRGDTA